MSTDTLIRPELSPDDQSRLTLVLPVASEITRAYAEMRPVDEASVANYCGLPATAGGTDRLGEAEQFSAEALRTRAIGRGVANIAILESKRSDGFLQRAKVGFELFTLKHVTARSDYQFGKRTGLLGSLVEIANGRKQTLLERYDAELAARQ
jgi:hypothetical protein